MPVATYLFFDGTCEAAFTLYRDVLGGRIVAMLRPGDVPGSEASPPEMRNQVMHACLELDGQHLMASDCPQGQYSRPQGFAVHFAPTSAAEAERIFAALAEGGSVTMPLAQTFWAERFGMLVDGYGTPWMINYAPPCPQG